VHELEHYDHPWIREYFGGKRGRTAAEAHEAIAAGAH
jgi:ABC-type transporter Mla maintaining outer membrane lipid asymmetry ATPase subunit MlaF